MRLSSVLRLVQSDRRAAGIDRVALLPVVIVEELLDLVAITLPLHLGVLDAADVLAHMRADAPVRLLRRQVIEQAPLKILRQAGVEAAPELWSAEPPNWVIFQVDVVHLKPVDRRKRRGATERFALAAAAQSKEC
jgi:hypothetical protein